MELELLGSVGYVAEGCADIIFVEGSQMVDTMVSEKNKDYILPGDMKLSEMAYAELKDLTDEDISAMADAGNKMMKGSTDLHYSKMFLPITCKMIQFALLTFLNDSQTKQLIKDSRGPWGPQGPRESWGTGPGRWAWPSHGARFHASAPARAWAGTVPKPRPRPTPLSKPRAGLGPSWGPICYFCLDIPQVSKILSL